MEEPDEDLHFFSFSIFINGPCKGFFKGSQGLHQGDPLSPYPFIIVVELLSRMVSKAKSCGLSKAQWGSVHSFYSVC